MAGQSRGLIKGYRAEAAIPARRIAKFGSADGLLLTAAAATDLVLGITTEIAAAAGEPCDLVRSGITDVTYGGTVARGQKLTSDASGRAIAAVPAAGANVQIIGTAEVSAVVGDIGPAFISLSVMQG